MDQIPLAMNPLVHAGTNRFGRLEQALNEDYVQIEERHSADFIQQAYRLSQAIQYYDLHDQADGDWKKFFAPEVASNQPHKALFLAFLELLELLHTHTNTLGRRHLDYYYRDVLQFVEREAVPSKAHLFFTCARNIKTRFLAQDTEAFAGKSEAGKDQLFRLVDEIVVNQIAIDEVRMLFREEDESTDHHNRLFTGHRPVATVDDEQWSLYGDSQLEFTYNETDRAFVKTILPPEKRTLEVAEVGFAISTPMLRLEGGLRKIDLKLITKNPRIREVLTDDFDCWVSTPEGWKQIPKSALTETQESQDFSGLKNLIVSIELEEDFPVISDFDTAIHTDSYDTTYPVLKWVCKHYDDAQDPIKYTLANWKDIEIASWAIRCQVDGLRSVILQNERTPIDPSKPFLPFGPAPSIGEHFYIGHNQAFRYPLSTLSLNLEWKDVPAGNLRSHFAGYSNTVNNVDFKVTPELLLDRKWTSLGAQNALFHSTDARDAARLNFDLTQNNVRAFRTPERDYFQWDLDTKDGFIRLTLEGPEEANLTAFGHQNYSRLAATNNQIKPPLNPKLEAVKLNYSTDWHTVDYHTELEAIYQVAPFGVARTEATTTTKRQLVPSFESAGAFYLALTQVTAPQSLNLLFQFAEGSGDADESTTKTDIVWHYLVGDLWKELNPLRISKDTTRGLLNTGTIRIDLPEDIDDQHHLMPTGKFWLRASLPEKVAGIDRVVGIHAQAAEIEQIENGEGRLLLEAGNIEKLHRGEKGIASVSQPYVTFSGRDTEQGDAFYARVSERLRHKDRATHIWDYERLVLDEFQDIYKVKCLNHTNLETEQVAGHVMLAVVPDLRKNKSVNIFQPKVGVSTRLNIRDSILTRTNPFLNLRVENPIYEPLKISLKVGFHVGYDEGFYGLKLQDDIQRFLSPWAFEDGKDLTFGGELHKSTILKFIEDLPYVDYVNDLTMFHVYRDRSLFQNFNEGIEPCGNQEIIRFRHQSERQGTDAIGTIKVRFFTGLCKKKNADGTPMDPALALKQELETVLRNREKKGQDITRNLIYSLVKATYYVDKILDLEFFYRLADGYVMQDVDVAVAKTSRTIMVSSEGHYIQVYRAGDYQCDGNVMKGIGFMIVKVTNKVR